VFSATFNNISLISRRSVLLVEETGVQGETHRLVASFWQTLWLNVVSSTPGHERKFELTTLVVIGTGFQTICYVANGDNVTDAVIATMKTRSFNLQRLLHTNMCCSFGTAEINVREYRRDKVVFKYNKRFIIHTICTKLRPVVRASSEFNSSSTTSADPFW
jgi:hypothetical protein